jgi:AmiR/NasT family two-component response regulator
MPEMSDDDLALPNIVHIATGVVAEEQRCDVADALDRLKLRARSTGQTLEQVAHGVIDAMTFGR